MLARLGLMAIVCAVAALVLAAAPTPARADTPDAEVEPGTITTVLQPGYNMVGWLGPETSSSQLFKELPALRVVSAWDGEEQRPRSASLDRYEDLPTLKRGMALWVHVGGDVELEWTRRVAVDGVLLQLRAGSNFVGWAGRDGTPLAAAFDRFGDALVRVTWWDEEVLGYRHYSPNMTEATESPGNLSRGDALWVELAAECAVVAVRSRPDGVRVPARSVSGRAGHVPRRDG